MSNTSNEKSKKFEDGYNPEYFKENSETEEVRVKKIEDRLISEDRPQRVRIFKSDFLEKFTLVKWHTIFKVWIPVIVFLYYQSFNEYQLSALEYIATFVLGILAWTLAEYLIHRYPFHLKPNSKWGKKAVYSMHGNHHDDPFDPLRGVMPIAPAIFYILILYFVFNIIVPDRYISAFFASFLVGYLAYDGIHYFTHHGRPTSKLGKYLKRIHLVHHVHNDCMFGISSPLWDILFGTYLNRGYKAPKEF